MMKSNFKKPHPIYAAQQGFTLVELMIALLIGLIVVAAAAGMFLSNSRVYGTTESVSRIQENTRAAFEVMSRDIREAGVTACRSTSELMGNHAALPQIQAGLWAVGDVLDIYLSNSAISTVVEHTDPASAIKIAPAAGTAYAANEVLVICNSDSNLLFNANFSTGASGTTLTPSSSLTDSQGAGMCFWKPAASIWSLSCEKQGQSISYVSKVLRHRWEVRNNPRGGRSLYREVAYPDTSGGMQNVGSAEEIAENVDQMTLAFRRHGDNTFQGNFASWTGEDWKKVEAVQISLVFLGNEEGNAQGTDGARLTRNMVTATAVRNRESLL